MIERESKPRPTIEDVAELAGVSIATVSRVLNQTAPVTAETADKVWEVVEALKYTPHAAARGLASRKTSTIGLLLPEISGHFFSLMLRGVEACVCENGFDLLVHSTPCQRESRLDVPRSLGEHNTDGLLVYAGSLDPEEIARLDEAGFPVVLLHQSPPEGLDIPTVTYENKAGARRLVDHLIEAHGYQRIAFLAGPDNNEDSYWREVGYRESLAAHDLVFDPGLVSIGGFDARVAESAVSDWLLEGIEMDAIFAGDDESAIGALMALNRSEWRVPEDVAVVGFDDIYLSEYLTPPLTTVRAPIETAGYQAAEHLFQLLIGKQVESSLLLPTELVIRRSCGCNAA
jgi:DNA-binding LacI/PurR family transcriptional regulator